MSCAVEYVRYWTDGCESYCLIQLSGNESELHDLTQHLEETKSFSGIEKGMKMGLSEVKALQTWAFPLYIVVSGILKLPRLPNGKIDWSGQDDCHYSKIRQFTILHPDLPNTTPHHFREALE